MKEFEESLEEGVQKFKSTMGVEIKDFKALMETRVKELVTTKVIPAVAGMTQELSILKNSTSQ
eukprot:15356178-Ditylum_brightwellii.AAC.1